MPLPSQRFVLSLLAFVLCATGLGSLRAEVWQWSAPDGDARAYLWIPENCERVRGVVVSSHNMIEQGILEHPAMRGTLARLGFAELWVVPYLDATFDFNTGAGEHFDRIVSGLAAASGYAELATAPVVPLGHSACATFPWNFAAWAPERTLALISYKGDAPRTTLTGNGHKRIEWGDRSIAGIPALMVMGQYEWWEDRLAPAFEFMAAHPDCPVAFLADTGRGHFDFSDRTVAFLARFIEKAAAARLPASDASAGAQGSAKLRPVDPRAGWRVDRWHPDAPPAAPVAPCADYTGDARSAFWCFDEEMARATETIHAEGRGKLPALLSITDGAQALEQGNGEPVTPRFLPEADGITFRLHSAFLASVPGNSPKGALWTGLPVGAKVEVRSRSRASSAPSSKPARRPFASSLVAPNTPPIVATTISGSSPRIRATNTSAASCSRPWSAPPLAPKERRKRSRFPPSPINAPAHPLPSNSPPSAPPACP